MKALTLDQMATVQGGLKSFIGIDEEGVEQIASIGIDEEGVGAKAGIGIDEEGTEIDLGMYTGGQSSSFTRMNNSFMK